MTGQKPIEALPGTAPLRCRCGRPRGCAPVVRRGSLQPLLRAVQRTHHLRSAGTGAARECSIAAPSLAARSPKQRRRNLTPSQVLAFETRARVERRVSRRSHPRLMLRGGRRQGVRSLLRAAHEFSACETASKCAATVVTPDSGSGEFLLDGILEPAVIPSLKCRCALDLPAYDRLDPSRP